jgi:hypothetical protein
MSLALGSIIMAIPVLILENDGAARLSNDATRLPRRLQLALDPTHCLIGFHRIRAVAIETLKRPPSRATGRQR